MFSLNPSITSAQMLDDAQLVIDYGAKIFDGVGTGFSAWREYPSRILYIPPRLNNGESYCAAMFKVALRSEGRNGFGLNSIEISVSCAAKSWHDSVSDDPDAPKAIARDSLKVSNKSIKPFEINSNDYIYDSVSNCYRDGKREVVSLERVFEEVFQAHLGPTYPIRGLILRMRRRLFEGHNAFLLDLQRVLEWILGYGFGRVLRSKDLPTLTGYTNEEMLLSPKVELVSRGDYKVPINVVITESFLLLLIGSALYFWKNISIEKFLTVYGLGSVIVALPLLFFLDKGVPRLILCLYNFLVRRRWNRILSGITQRCFFGCYF